MGFLLKSLGLEALSDAPVGDYSAHLVPPSRSDTTSVTLTKAVGLPAVSRSFQIIYGVGGRLPFDAWRGNAKVPRAPQLVRQPDPWRPRRSWTVRALTGMAGDGNCFLRLSPDLTTSTRTIVAAEVMNPFAVKPRYDKSGRKVYDHYAARGKFETLSSEEVEHIWLNEFPGQNRGLGPIEANRLTLSGALSVADYANGWFDRGAIPPGVLTTEHSVDKTTADEMKDWWHEDSSRVKVVSKGLHFEPILIKPEDAQWIEAQKFSVLAIANMFGIPPVMLAAAIDGSSLTYQNLQMVHEQLLNTTLFPLYLDAIEAALTNLVANGQEVRFDASRLLRRDDKTRMETHKVAIDSGIYDADYARELEGIEGPAPRKVAAA